MNSGNGIQSTISILANRSLIAIQAVACSLLFTCTIWNRLMSSYTVKILR